MTRIDRERSARRIEHDIETLAGPAYTSSSEAICRYAYTDVYERTLRYFTDQLEGLGFRVWRDPVGTLVASNVEPGAPAFGIGSHCDSNRNGGKYDGTLGVCTALEVCRLAVEAGGGVPLRLISFLEEEGSGFGQMLLGSRIMAQRVTEEELRTSIVDEDGVPFWDSAARAGYPVERWRDSIRTLDGLTGWVEVHIEQGRVLQDTARRIGVVQAIAGYVHGDLRFAGRADHAGATPMGYRNDASVVAAECVLELERLAEDASRRVPTVGTAGEGTVVPNLINVVPAEVRVGLDIRSVERDSYRGVVDAITSFAETAAQRRGLRTEYRQRQETLPTTMDAGVVAALERAVQATGQPYRLMPSGASHDTQLVAPHVPSAMLFVPCLDGVSHSPDESASSDDAALGAELMLTAIRDLVA